MKNFYSILFLLFFYSLAYSQQDSTKTWIEVWQKSTVSIGKIDTVVYKTQKIPFYRVIGTGVLFYTKYDTIVIPCLITAKHIFEDLNNNWCKYKGVYKPLLVVGLRVLVLFLTLVYLDK